MIGKLVLFIALMAPLGAPGFAQGCTQEERAATCSEGWVWDAEKRMCTEQVMG